MALIKQADGGLFLVSMNANDDGSVSLVALYRLDCNILPPCCLPIALARGRDVCHVDHVWPRHSAAASFIWMMRPPE